MLNSVLSVLLSRRVYSAAAHGLACALFLGGQLFAAAAAEPLSITEFLASNKTGLQDEDADRPDWIEILNSSTATVSLDGWFLTDAADNLTKWRFPATNLAPNGFLIVFASGKDRAVPGLPLHANFSLSANGEYLALVKPDGQTVVSEFSPAFPPQYADISFGIAQDLHVTKLVSNTSPARYLVPSDNTLALKWHGADFNDSTWALGTNGVGYETYVPGFAVRNYRANVSVCDLATALIVPKDTSKQAAMFTETAPVINYFNTGGQGHFDADSTFPGFTINADVENFVTEATGIVTIPAAGNYTFGVNSDDGFRVTVGDKTFEYAPPRGPGDTFATFALAAGDYPVTLIFYECGGGSEVEFFAAAGSYAGWDAAFRLVGDTANGGLEVKSLPVTGTTSPTLRPLIKTDVEKLMLAKNASAYIRIPFAIANPAVFSTLTLRMKYNDGFVAYLNGTEVARRNAPATTPWNSVATASRPTASAASFEDVDLSSRLGLLRAGANVLAFQGLNDSIGGANFLVLAELVENKVLGLTNHYFSTPTPAAFNSIDYLAFVGDLRFSPDRGFFQSTNFALTLSSDTPGASIRYTTNGSAPSATNGVLYTDPIAVGRTTILRAVAYKDGFEPTPVETHSYLFLDCIQNQNTNADYVGGSAGDYTMNTNVTQAPAYRGTFRDDLLAIPTLSLAVNSDDFFGPSGIYSNPTSGGLAWERPCSAEFIRPDGKKGFHLNCGLRIQGGVSRSAIPKHSLRLLFKSDYGPSKLDYALYPDSPVQEFDTLTLHACFNDHWLWGGTAATELRDLWCRDTQIAMSGFGAHGTCVHLYINGIYWGLHNIGEQADASFGAHYLGGDKEEYDAVNSDQVVDGNGDAWSQMIVLADAGIASDVAYTNLAQYLDIPSFIDYMLMNQYAANTDWPWHNWKAVRRRLPGAGFHFVSWDAEWTMGIGNDLNTDITGEWGGSPGLLYKQLRAHPEFRREYADHVQKHCFNGGALTPAAAQARWDKRTAEIERAIVCEAARWGGAYTPDNWTGAAANVRAWFPQRTRILINQLRAAGLFPQLSAPTFAPFGGLVPPGCSLSLTNPNSSGTVYYTTDGTDPRLWGGSLAATAKPYANPLALDNAAFLRARVRDGTNWSALVETVFYVVQDFSSLTLTEIMYNPPSDGSDSGEDLEFLELKNTGTATLDLSGLHFTAGISFAFTNGARLEPGRFFVLAQNPVALAAKYPGLIVSGAYTGKLSNGGDRLTLSHVLGTNVFSFKYQTRPPWPVAPDGYGFSLVRADLAGDPDAAVSWRSSSQPGGSPGADDPPANIPPVVVNEISTHAEPPQTDAIELFNPLPSTVGIGGWFLTDDLAEPRKYRIPDGTTILPGGFAVFREQDFNPTPGFAPSFSLSSWGESLYLFSGDASTNLTGYSHGLSFGPSASGVSFGRHLLSTGKEEWPAQSAVTLGAANSGPRAGPVVINEIMYHPPAGYDEFIELYNLGTTNVPLYDPAHPTNGWRLSGIGYSFSSDMVMPPASYLLLVPVDPDLFRAKYHISPQTPILGPYSGALQGNGESLRLECPGSPDTNGLPFILVDEVRYSDRSPWPAGADGDGPSLQRSAPASYGNEPTNWFASGITPGLSNTVNRPPLCSLISPTNGASLSVPVDLILAADASDSDGAVVKVEFYDGAIKLGESISPPFAFIWSNAPIGLHQITAKARDDRLAVGASATATVTITPPPVGTGVGLRAVYYNNADFSGSSLQRLDATVNFDWGSGSPDSSVEADSFSVRWTGLVQPRFGETYSFHTFTDDGVRLWVNDQLIVNNWTDHGVTEDVGQIALQAGAYYKIKMEYYENGGGATARLLWSSASVALEVVPQTQLYPDLAPAIAAQPASQTVTVGNSASFRVTATNYPTGYQWYFNNAPIPGAAFASLVLPQVQFSNAGPYKVLVTNAYGSVFSANAVLTVVDSLYISQQPQSLIFNTGSTNTSTTNTTGFGVLAAGIGPLTYQWLFWGTNLPGATNATLVISNLSLSHAGTYAVRVSDTKRSLLSSNAQLSVLVKPFIYVPIQAQSVVYGGTASFSVLAGPHHPTLPLSYLWQRNGVYFLTNDRPTLILDNVTNSASYLVRVVNPAGGVNRIPVSLTVLADSDRDGVPDVLELLLGTATNNPADGSLDSDGDGMNNADEVAAGTDPLDPKSVLRLQFPPANAISTSDVLMHFTAVSNHTYSVQCREGFGLSAWSNVLSLDSLPTNRLINVTNSLLHAPPSQFYRVKTPRSQ